MLSSPESMHAEPAAWAALVEANQGHAPGYGDDPWTLEAADMIILSHAHEDHMAGLHRVPKARVFALGPQVGWQTASGTTSCLRRHLTSRPTPLAG